jgi:hypothetical protein
MWLPTPLYELIPKIWLVLGCLFIAHGIYLRMDLPPSLGAFIMGIVCIVYGIGVAVVRSRHRKKLSEDGDSPATPQ